MADYKSVLDRLVHSSHPTIEYKTRLNILGEDPKSPSVIKLQSKIKSSSIPKSLLAERNRDAEFHLTLMENGTEHIGS